jgi:hypothetical protein
MAKRLSRVIGKNLNPSLDSNGVPQFGSLERPARTPTKREERRETTRTRTIPSLAEHAEFLRSVGHQNYLIPGTLERIDMLQRWIATAHPIEAQDHRQLERWQKELEKCQVMKQSSSLEN